MYPLEPKDPSNFLFIPIKGLTVDDTYVTPMMLITCLPGRSPIISMTANDSLDWRSENSLERLSVSLLLHGSDVIFSVIR